MTHSKAVLYVAGAPSADHLLQTVGRLGFDCATCTIAQGLWQGEIEQSYVLTIIGETATPAHIAGKTDQYGNAILMPAVPDGFELRIRYLAENLTREYKQDCVAFELTELALFELTTSQASYIRNGG